MDVKYKSFLSMLSIPIFTIVVFVVVLDTFLWIRKVSTITTGFVYYSKDFLLIAIIIIDLVTLDYVLR